MEEVQILTENDRKEMEKSREGRVFVRGITGAVKFLCGKGIGKRFAYGLKAYTDFIFYVEEKKEDVRDIKGFAMVSIHDEFLYIDLICAKGVGSAILAKVEEKARIMRKKSVVLCSVKNPFSFYKYKGYEIIKSCRDDLTWKGHKAENTGPRERLELRTAYDRKTGKETVEGLAGCVVWNDGCMLMEKIVDPALLEKKMRLQRLKNAQVKREISERSRRRLARELNPKRDRFLPRDKSLGRYYLRDRSRNRLRKI